MIMWKLICVILLLCTILPHNALAVDNVGDASVECLSKLKADVVFLLDTSKSIQARIFDFYVKSFVLDFVKRVQIGRSHVMVGLATFDDVMVKRFNCGDFVFLNGLLEKIGSVNYNGGDKTATGDAMAQLSVDTQMFSNRPGVPKIVVLLTDGRSNEGIEVASGAAKLKRVVDRVIAIGIGNESSFQKELQLAASSPSDVYSIKNHDDLESNVVDITKWKCQVYNPCNATYIAELRQSETREKRSVAQFQQFTQMQYKRQGMMNERKKTTLQTFMKSEVSMSEEIYMKKSQIISVQQQIRLINTRLTSLKVSVREEETKATKMARFQRTVEVKWSKSMESLEKVTHLFSSYKLKLLDLSGQLQVLKANSVKLRQERAKVMTRIEQAKLRLVVLKAKFEDMSKTTVTVEGKNTRELNLIQQEYIKIMTSVTQLTSSSLRIEASTRTVVAINVRLQKRLELMKMEVLEYQRLVTSCKLHVREIRVSIEQQEKTLIQLRAEYGSRISKTETQITTMQQMIKTAKSNIAQYTSLIQQQEFKKIESMSSVTVLRVQIEATMQELSFFRKRQTTLQSMLLETKATIRRSSNDTVTISKNLQTCERYAQEGGCHLALSIDAGSGVNFRQLLRSGIASIKSSNATWKRSSQLSYWPKSAYFKVVMSFEKDDRTVARLDFDTTRVGKDDWFNIGTLIASSPWSIDIMKKQFISSFGINNCENKGCGIFTSTNGCGSGYIQIADGGNCATMKGKKFPQFLFTMNTNSKPDDFANSFAADRLKLFLCPYDEGLRFSKNAPKNLLLAISEGSNVNAYNLATGSLISPGSALPLKVPSHDWYRSEAMQMWSTGKFERVGIAIYNAQGEAVHKVVFNADKSYHRNWFRGSNLISFGNWKSISTLSFEYKHTSTWSMSIGTFGKNPCDFVGYLVVISDREPCLGNTKYPVILYSDTEKPMPLRQMKRAAEIRQFASVEPVSLEM